MLSKQEIRIILLYGFKLDCIAVETTQTIIKAFEDEAISESTMYR